MTKVVITSKNPVKIESIKLAFSKMFPELVFSFESVSVDSGVGSQPITDRETKLGAINRVDKAKTLTKADYYVGIEGGIQAINDEMESFAWIYIDGSNKVGKAKTATFYLPAKVIELVNQGYELGEADDIVFNKTDSKQANGAIGLLTGDVITRTSYYTEALCMALVPFKNKNLY
ncbi:MAG: inosine/xanthosine triphosphatase [Patescibacteria group bacterium]